MLSATEALRWCSFEDILKPFIVLLAPPPTAPHTSHTHTHTHTHTDTHTPLWPFLSDSPLCVTGWVTAGLSGGWMRGGCWITSLPPNVKFCSQFYLYSLISQYHHLLQGVLQSAQHTGYLWFKWGKSPSQIKLFKHGKKGRNLRGATVGGSLSEDVRTYVRTADVMFME